MHPRKQISVHCFSSSNKIAKRFLAFAAALLLVSCSSILSSAQLLQQLSKSPAASADKQQDSLGRDTPSGAVFGFLQAAQARNYSLAAQYLQLQANRRQAQGIEIATQLKSVLDGAYQGSVRRISNQPDGNMQEGVPPDRQDLGTLSAGDVEAPLVLVRVSDQGVKVWLFSAETLAKVPELYDQLEVHQVETHLPRFFVVHQFGGLAIWQWLAILLGIPAAMAVAWLLAKSSRVFRFLWPSYKKQEREEFWAAVDRPLWTTLSVWIHWFCMARLRLPLLPRHYYIMTAGVLFVGSLSWLVWRVLQQVLRRLRQHAIYGGRAGTGTLMLLGERMLKAVIFVTAVFAIFGTLGFNMTTPLAGLGIGGIAVAFAAQKTLENLFGGVSILADEVIRVGDVLRVGDRTGTVEDISLRSTRLRTPERTQLSIPNGTLATMNIDNLSRRDKILFTTKLGLRCETSADQLRYVLSELRRLLYQHPKVETDGARVRFISFDASALTLEVFCYVLTRDYPEFAAVQEDLLLWMMEILAESGTGFAFPSQTLYMGKDSGMDREKSEAAEKKIQELRKAGKMPFPDFASDEIAHISNSLPYPQPEASVRKAK